MKYEDKEHLLQDFYNFCMDKYDGMCKEEAIYDYLSEYHSDSSVSSGRKEAITELALDNLQREWEENEAFHKKRHKIVKGIRSSQMSALVTYLVDIGVITDDNVNNQTII